MSSAVAWPSGFCPSNSAIRASASTSPAPVAHDNAAACCSCRPSSLVLALALALALALLSPSSISGGPSELSRRQRSRDHQKKKIDAAIDTTISPRASSTGTSARRKRRDDGDDDAMDGLYVVGVTVV